ncbi:hypothetical protein D3C78_941750 [compost metagenome]
MVQVDSAIGACDYPGYVYAVVLIKTDLVRRDFESMHAASASVDSSPQSGASVEDGPGHTIAATFERPVIERAVAGVIRLEGVARDPFRERERCGYRDRCWPGGAVPITGVARDVEQVRPYGTYQVGDGSNLKLILHLRDTSETRDQHVC